ncbi:MAG TPA: S-layer homology domain-containing protein [Clostridiales bacterium]|nr:S-layer homology domain-containing protein [Clostridiales bacterium]
MKKRIWLLLMILSVSVWLLFPAGLSAARSLNQWSALSLPAAKAGEDSTSLPFMAAEMEEWKDEDAGSSTGKLSSTLRSLVDDAYLPEGKTKSDVWKEMKEQGQISEMPTSNGTSATREIGVYVYIRLCSGDDLEAIEPFLLSLENYDEASGLVAAWVNVDQLAAVAALDAVCSMTEVVGPRVDAGSVVTAGDNILKAAQMRSTYGVDGTGVKIGVISDGVDHLSSAIAKGDLPASVSVLSNTYGGDEGTAMLEIIHDIAPGAKLYFHDCGTNVLAFNRGIDNLIAAGCDIICDDIGWISEPFFEDGVVAQHVKEISDQGKVLFVSSAGNSGEDHYQGNFYRGAYDFHDFSRGASEDKDLYMFIPANAGVTVVLQWNDPAGNVTSDYDIALANYHTDTMLEYSVDNNTVTGVPREIVYYDNTSGKDILADFYVHAALGNSSDILEVYIYCDGNAYSLTDNQVARDSIFGHPAVPGVLACGAIDVAKPNFIESYSSRGPVTMLSGIREKPDICGMDRVAVTGAGGFPSPFYGTSAASPHVAAVAALMKSRFPSLSAAEIRTILLNQAVDLGSAGYDFDYGYGRVDALKTASSYCNVYFDSCGGSSVTTKVVVSGSNVTIPTAPKRSGYGFTGWYSDKECNHLYDFNTAVKADTTLYAGWMVAFDDVKEDAWYTQGVNFVVKHQLFFGVGEHRFAPNEQMTRAMFVTVLYRYAGKSQVEKSGNQFSDVVDNVWYTDGVIWGVAEGITNGTGNNKFSPNAPITREAIVTMLRRYLDKNSLEIPLKYDKIAFADDERISSWAKESVVLMQRAGIVNGKTSVQFCPQDHATRAEVATIIYRLMLAIENES